MLVSAKNLYHTHKADKGMSISQWSVEKAEEVLKAWQREFTKVSSVWPVNYILFLYKSVKKIQLAQILAT